MLKHIDLTGKKFGRLTVIKLDHIERKYRKDRNMYENNFYYLCRCECGNEKIIDVSNLRNGGTQSCGCYAKEIAHKLKATHNNSRTKLYKVWQSMKTRCYNKNHIAYKDYGARGITICQEWLDDFMSFYNWSMENGYKESCGLSIDRINNNGNYEPSNCRWATRIQQERNKRKTRYLTYNGETHCMKEWAEIIGINYSTLRTRLNVKKWTVERALNKKVRKWA